MKKTIITSIIVAIAIMIIPSFSFAQTNAVQMKNNLRDKKLEAPGVKPINAMEKVRDAKAVVGEDKMRPAQMMKEKRELEFTKDGQIRAKDGGAINRKERMGKHLEIITERLNAGVSRLEQLISRIESRNTKLKSEGKDVSISEKAVENAKAEIEKAKSDISSLSDLFENVSDEEITPTTETSAAVMNAIKATQDADKQALGKVRETIKSAKGHLESAKKYLVNSLSTIKGFRSPEETKKQKPEVEAI